MSKQKVLLFSGKALSGKDTCVGFAKKHFEGQNKKVVRLAFGDLVKFVAEKYFSWNGEKDEIGRSLLQYVGTDKAREIMPNIWVDMVIMIAKGLFHDYDYILISDCRFINEIDRWKSQGFNTISIRVNRHNFNNGMTDEQKQHLSETSLDDYKFDYYVNNIYDSLEEFESAFISQLEEIVK